MTASSNCRRVRLVANLRSAPFRLVPLRLAPLMSMSPADILNPMRTLTRLFHAGYWRSMVKSELRPGKTFLHDNVDDLFDGCHMSFARFGAVEVGVVLFD